MADEDLAAELALDEQAALAGGGDEWHTVALRARGIPRLKVTDGPSGARGESYTTTTSASFPCGSAVGASFDPSLAARVAAAIADEARTKGAHVVLGPTLNLHRHPLGGRNFESFGEDPLLVARLGAAYVAGLQARGVGACPKHLVANDAEIERLTISSEVDERTLREVYLQPFEAALRDAGAWTLMASYNRINGTFACENYWLLTELVKGEWEFDGVVISDWHATHHTVRCAEAGLDLEMPGPAKHFGAPLVDAVKRGDVDADLVADKARRILRLLDRVGAEAGPERPERSEDDPARWALAREAAAAAMVLLTNRDGLLPLDPARLRRVAVIGPNADVAIVQ
ncbi:MAG TPA: glycoside hydrolase family 3 N-terminal domain-containing protein, partial [Acidimicrobiales bacterium]|nr:glycoside hydrolase family 3 N-terminal domain-containing protein [Acidimicrobiales bacterium]